MGDEIGITDSTGTLIAQYEYDEWGNVLSTSENDIANINPTSLQRLLPRC